MDAGDRAASGTGRRGDRAESGTSGQEKSRAFGELCRADGLIQSFLYSIYGRQRYIDLAVSGLHIDNDFIGVVMIHKFMEQTSFVVCMMVRAL